MGYKSYKSVHMTNLINQERFEENEFFHRLTARKQKESKELQKKCIHWHIKQKETWEH